MRRAVYVGSSLHNTERVKQIQKRFIDEGCIITYDWTVHGQVDIEDELREIGIAEEKGVADADVLFLVFPAREGSHWEGGLARGLQLCGHDIAIVILAEVEQEKKSFHYTDGVQRFTDENAAIQYSLDFLDRKLSHGIDEIRD